MDAEVLKCPFCNYRVFKRQCHLLNHMRIIHKQSVTYTCKTCNKTFTGRNHFVLHKKVHNTKKYAEKGKYKEEIIMFDCFSEFNKWKEVMEAQTRSSFVKIRGSRRNKDHTLMQYRCHRSGKYTPRGKQKRSLKSKGSNKINGHCPARMSVKCYENRVVVSFIKTHAGHSMDLHKLTLTKKERDMIAEKIAMKIPLDDILDNITDYLSEENSGRLVLINRKDLWNIINRYNLKNIAVTHKDSNISVEEWIVRIQESSNIIRLYKPRGCMLDNYPQLEINDFLIIIANDVQLKLLSTFGNDILCINGTHGTNDNDFHLYTVLVLDELQEAIPCSFLITNREDTVAMKVYFSVLLDCLPSSISPKYFMSDMTESFLHGWSSVTTAEANTNTHQLYSSWHVDQEWRSALSKIHDKQKQIEIYKNLKVIMYEPDAHSFNAMTENFFRELCADTVTKEFAEYFELFVHNPAAWAFCFRLSEGVNTNMSLENMHVILQHVYLHGKKVQRLDKGIHVLMQFTREKIHDRFTKIHKVEATHKLSDLRARHKASMSLSYDSVQNMSGKWHVSSSKNFSDYYEVVPANTQCNCNLKCDDCKICIHYFRCTCLDATIRWNMCKHIHLVAQKMHQESSQCSTNLTDFVEVVIEQPDSIGIDYQLEKNTDVESEVIIEQLTEKCTTEDLNKRKILFIEKILDITNMMESLDELEAVEKIMAPAEQVILSLKNDRLVQENV